MLRKSSIKEIRNAGLLKYLFNTWVRLALHYGAELWGFHKGLNLERMQLRVFKRMSGLGNKFNGLVLRGDIRIKCMRHSRLISMVKYWERLSAIEDNRLVKQAFFMMLQYRRKDSWPNQAKNILDRDGLCNCWNERKGIGGMVGTKSRLVAAGQESQEA